MQETNICFFDYETKSLNKKGASWYPDNKAALDAYTYPVSICYIIAKADGTIVKDVYEVLYPETEKGELYTSEPKAFAAHGITQEHGLEFGKPIKTVHAQFMEDLKNCSMIVAHNGITFDVPIAIATAIRYGLAKHDFGNEMYELMSPAKRFDTYRAKKIKAYVGAVNSRGHAKGPNMNELHQKCFNKGFENAHNAHGDVLAMMNCFFEMLKQGVFDMEYVLNPNRDK